MAEAGNDMDEFSTVCCGSTLQQANVCILMACVIYVTNCTIWKSGFCVIACIPDINHWVYTRFRADRRLEGELVVLLTCNWFYDHVTHVRSCLVQELRALRSA